MTLTPHQATASAANLPDERAKRVSYAEWIARNVTGGVAGLCGAYTKQMQAVFPELRRARGVYCCPITKGRYQHWWLVDADGFVIDPTVKQFASGGLGTYAEWTDEEVEERCPMGRCYNCGIDIFKNDPEARGGVCSDACYSAYAAYLRDCMRT